MLLDCYVGRSVTRRGKKAQTQGLVGSGERSGPWNIAKSVQKKVGQGRTANPGRNKDRHCRLVCQRGI